jgi:hypothetical protein
VSGSANALVAESSSIEHALRRVMFLSVEIYIEIGEKLRSCLGKYRAFVMADADQ